MKKLIDWNDIKKKLKAKDNVHKELEFLESINKTITGPLLIERQTLLEKRKALLKKRKDLSDEEKKRLELITESVWGGEESISGYFDIPASIVRIFFGRNKKDPQIYLWALKHNAKRLFDIKIKERIFKEEVFGNDPGSFIKARIDLLTELEERANKLGPGCMEPGAVPIRYEREAEYRRIKGGYYTNHICNMALVSKSLPVDVYCDHWIMKPFLEGEMKLINKKPKSNSEGSGRIYLSIPQVAILCKAMDINITVSNAKSILADHTKLKSEKTLLREKIKKVDTITEMTGNKTTDSKRKKNLEAVKQYASSTKNSKAIIKIDQYLQAFQTNYRKKYED